MAAQIAGVPNPWVVELKWVSGRWTELSSIGCGRVFPIGDRSWAIKSWISFTICLQPKVVNEVSREGLSLAFNSSNGQVVRAFASRAVESGFISNRVWGCSQPSHFGRLNTFGGSWKINLNFSNFCCFPNLNRSISVKWKVYAERKNLLAETKNASNQFAPVYWQYFQTSTILSRKKNDREK